MTNYFSRWMREEQDLQIGYVWANRGKVAFWEYAHMSVHRIVNDRNLFTTGGLNRRGEVNPEHCLLEGEHKFLLTRSIF